MKYLLFILLSLSATISNAQQLITIQGKAFDTTKGRSWVKVIRNDTIRKLFANPQHKWKDYEKLIKDSNYVSIARQNGVFRIKAALTDTLFFESDRYIPLKISVQDLIAKKDYTVLLEPEKCLEYVPCKEFNKNHFVFIGKKIKLNYAIEKYYCNVIMMDSKYNAAYSIIEPVYGNMSGDTAKFVVYDHNGNPEFGKHETVMLFLSESCGEWFHQKYQFFPVYQTIDGKWAAPYSASDYARLDSTSVIKPEIIKFKSPVEINLLGSSKEWIEKNYFHPYYKIENGKAIAVYGNYINELLELKKQTVLKSRGLTLD